MKSPSLKSFSKYLSYGPRIRPERDWLVLLAVFFILLCVSVGWNIWTFARATNGELLGAQNAVQKDSDLKLQSIQELFTVRADARTRYVSEYRFVDPSL